MAWIVLVVAGLFEIGWAIGLKYTEGFSRLWPSVATAAAMVVSVVLLGWSMRTLPVGTAYAVWTGIGAVGTVAAMVASVLLLGWAMRTLPVGTAYAVWTGIGAIGTVILGIYLFDEPATAARLACIGLILAGIVGLKLVA